jgi:starch synthase
MNIAFITCELAPWVKVGGLADVSSSLARALNTLGHEVQIIVPYTGVMERPETVQDPPRRCGHLADPAWSWQEVPLSEGLSVLWISGPGFSGRSGTSYADASGRLWPDLVERYAQFCKALVSTYAQPGLDTPTRPDILHGHDWPMGLLPFWAQQLGTGVPTVLTIHNLGYPGLMDRGTFDRLGLPPGLWNDDSGILLGQSASSLKAGLRFADQLTTVSPSYAREIATPEYGRGLVRLVRERNPDLSGILNGIDSDTWNPGTDPALPAHYTVQSISGKLQCRKRLLERLSLGDTPHPVAGFVGRLVREKGIDLLEAVIPELVARHWRLVLLGKGTPDMEHRLSEYCRPYQGKVALVTEQSESWAHLIMAGADLFLMPSRYEPCGLTQMYSQRYGTPPIAHAVGGLVDTVRDADSGPGGTGFLFDEPSAQALLSCCLRAERAFHDPGRWSTIRESAMILDFSWQSRAREYERIYRRAIDLRRKCTSCSAQSRAPKSSS